MKNLQSFPNRPAALQERIFDKVFQTAELAQFNKKERSNYEDSLKVYRDIKNSLDYAEEKGKKRGIEMGVEIGVEKGKKETQIENAKKAIKENLPLEIIAKITDLTIEEIQQIKDNLEE